MPLTDLRIDGDAIVYRAGFAADSRDGDLSHSLYNAKIIIESIVDKFPDAATTVYLTSRKPESNFRFQLVDNYKANRKGAPKPKYYKEIRQYLHDKYGAMNSTFGEADDAMGIDAHPDNTVIATNDKDLLMIPCWHYRISREQLLLSSDPGEIHLERNNKGLLGTGFKFFCAQMLMGDKVDNIIPPKKGFGPVACHKILEKCVAIREMWHVLSGHYYNNHQADLLMINAQLLWISRKQNQRFSFELLEELINEDEARNS